MDLSQNSAIMALAEEIISLKYAMTNLSTKFDILINPDAVETVNTPITSFHCKGAIEDIFSISNVECDDDYGNSLPDESSTSFSSFPESVMDRLSMGNEVQVDKYPIAAECILTYQEHLSDVFQYFSASELENSTEFTHFLQNRISVYYGSNSYTYGNITHDPQPFHKNPYLQNCSVMLTLCFLPYNTTVL